MGMNGSEFDDIVQGGNFLIKAGGLLVAIYDRVRSARQERVKAAGPTELSDWSSLRQPTSDIVSCESEVSLIIQFSRSVIPAVQQFIEQRATHGPVLIIAQDKDDDGFMIDLRRSVWEELVRTFHAQVQGAVEAWPGCRINVYLAAPSALAFAFGAIIGTLYDAHLFHWDGRTYVEVIRLNRSLLRSSS